MILGMDFLKKFVVEINYASGSWRAGEGKWYQFQKVNDRGQSPIVAECAGIREATKEQKALPKELLDELLPENQEGKLGCTHLVKHKIDIIPGLKPV